MPTLSTPILVKLVYGASPLVKPSELEMLEAICSKAAASRKIEDGDRDRLLRAFGQRFTRAWEAVESKRVKKYVFKSSNRIAWIVVGKARDYLIMPAADFCNCDDFYFRVMDRQVHLCYHLIAQKLAETLETFDLFEEEDRLYDTLMNEWRKAIA